MKLINVLMIAGLTSTSAVAASAQTTVPNTFTAGTQASASQVNANFATLANAINDLASRVSALEGPSDVTLNDLVGRTYCITSIGTISGGGGTNFARFSSYVSKGTLQITSTSQATLSGVSDNEHELNVSVGSNGLDSTVSQSSDPGSQAITINSLSNGVLSTSIGDLYLAKDGNVLLKTDFSFGASGNPGETQGEDSIAVGIVCR